MKFIHFLVFYSIIVDLPAQNLISNPGFETCDRCGLFGNQGVELTLGNNSNTPEDWYGVTFGSSDIRPDQPRTGRYHGGFFSFGKFEYLGNVLNQTLQPGAEYELSCYLGTRSDSEYSTDEIGFCFQQGKNLYQTATVLDRLIPQAVTPDGDFLPYKAYKKYSMRFIACGGEDHMIVGRFRDLNKGDTLFVGTRRSGNLYTYTIIDDVELVMVNPSPDLLPSEILVCENSRIDLQISPGPSSRSILWSTGESTEKISVNASAGFIWVELKYGDQCPPIRDTVQLILIENDFEPIEKEIVLCEGSSGVFFRDSTGLKNPRWNHGPAHFAISFDQVGDYTLVSESPCGILMDLVRVTVQKPLAGKLFDQSEVCLTDQLELIPNDLGPGKWRWNTGDTSRIIKPTSGGYFAVTLYNVCGEVTDSIYVKGDSHIDSLLQLPNTFTPNGDQMNDRFGPIFSNNKLNLVEDYRFQIYNRWGKIVFETSNPEESWNPVESAITESYIYFLELKANDCINTTVQRKSGTVSLIR
ncbi:MAG: gliding motility-associated C-terminal domain-containing protein [Saprospiraceae bacterium]|nr:gliding motility-associated C-terminal domain-containing protein [Saprospiraceae bacterium]